MDAGVSEICYLNQSEFRDFKQPSLLLHKPDHAIERYDNNITYFDQILDFVQLESLPLVVPLD